MATTGWTYYESFGGDRLNVFDAVFRCKPSGEAQRWDAASGAWVKIDHMFLPDRLADGDVTLEAITRTGAQRLGADVSI